MFPLTRLVIASELSVLMLDLLDFSITSQTMMTMNGMLFFVRQEFLKGKIGRQSIMEYFQSLDGEMVHMVYLHQETEMHL